MAEATLRTAKSPQSDHYHLIDGKEFVRDAFLGLDEVAIVGGVGVVIGHSFKER
jgi:hypothetical protein